METPNHLIIVCGHGIWLGGPAKGYDESEWLIQGFQKGETPTFIEHIKQGVVALSEDDRSALVFSGGPTRRESRLSEGLSYRDLAEANSYFGLLPDRRSYPSRILVEEKALDSYYNILFSLVLFWRAHQVWPSQITIVSHAFKRRRIVDLHCDAIGFLTYRINYLGVDPPGLTLDEDRASEQEKRIIARIVGTEKDWEGDPHGVGEVLASKRRERNAWGIDQKLFADEDERRRSGLETGFLDDGTETLGLVARRP